MKNFRQALVFIYLSVVFHAYVFWFTGYVLDPRLAEWLADPEKYRERIEQPITVDIENRIIPTAMESRKIPEKARISDKPNIDSGRLNPEVPDTYNYLNPDPAKASPAVVSRPGDMEKESVQEKIPDGLEPLIPDPSEAGSAPELKRVDPVTGEFSPEKPVSVFMDTEGRISLSTVSDSNAQYFLKMRDRIGENWSQFFPVFQYYRGILRNGRVGVIFEVAADGSVLNAEVVRSYGYSVVDQASLNAVIYSRNFGPLPEELKKDAPIRIYFDFIYVGR